MIEFTRNVAQCLHCGDIIESKYEHDFKRCSCWRTTEYKDTQDHGIFVDGGLVCPRHGWTNYDEYKDLSEKVEE